ncbi:MAG TPA: IPT/TIG domain-containing protein [Solirubrobacterales bacterium]|jgi:hypothetical protein|nr:IPT/TIG domain-containing protein [Solirubrobacterales bacterium]
MRNVNALGRLKRRLGANGPGIAVAVIAIVLAVTGAAYAAGGAFTSSQVKEVKAIIKKEAKKLRGPQGKQGAPGSQGSPGAKGDKGDNGAPGAAGAAGKNGAGVNVISIDEGEPECNELGGALVEKEGASSAAEVCNGARGLQGVKGEPWTPNNALPAGATETGTWSFNAFGGSGKTVFVPLSFPIPLTPKPESPLFGGLGASNVHYQTEPGFNSICEGANARPSAPLGSLCVYEGNPNEETFGATFQSISRTGAAETAGAAGATRAGALIVFNLTEETAAGNGTFAVTAPNPLVKSVSPHNGPAAGGTSVTITGENLQGGIVKFGTETATCGAVNSAGTEVTCTSPAHAAGTVDVTVTVSEYPSPTSGVDKYTFE